MQNNWLDNMLKEVQQPNGAFFYKQASEDKTKEVFNYLKKTYPTETLKWVDGAEWSQKKVSLDDIQMNRRPGGAREQDKVKNIAKAFKDKEKMEPVVLVKTPEGKLKVADGYHRTLGCKHAGNEKINAWVGKVEEQNGPWDKEMHEKKLNKGETAKKAEAKKNPPIDKVAYELDKEAFVAAVGKLGSKAIQSVGNSVKNFSKGITGSGTKAAKENLSTVKANPNSTRTDIKGAQKDLRGEQWNRAKSFGTVGLAGTAVGVNELGKNMEKEREKMLPKYNQYRQGQ